jgi:uncharacterized protein YecT (DUF1311 family)
LWSNAGATDRDLSDFFVIRTVTILEVFTRRNIGELIDHAKQFSDRAVEISKHIKMDFALVRDVQGRAITIGDVIAHSVPVNSFGQIISCFDALLGESVRPLLSRAVDRFAVECEDKPNVPIIEDFDTLARTLSRLFEIRHIVCHEMPRFPVYENSEVGACISASTQFARALEEVLTFARFGLVPLTQTDTNIAAGQELAQAENEMNSVLAEVEHRAGDCSEWIECLRDAQQKWLAFRTAQCEFETYLNRGGSIRPLRWANCAANLTIMRSEALRKWLDDADR